MSVNQVFDMFPSLAKNGKPKVSNDKKETTKLGSKKKPKSRDSGHKQTLRGLKKKAREISSQSSYYREEHKDITNSMPDKSIAVE